MYILWIISVIASLCILSLSFCLSPDDVERGALSFLSLPHDHCPLCGMSHSLTLMSRGDFHQAFIWNPGGPIFYILLTLNSVVGLFVGAHKALNRIKK